MVRQVSCLLLAVVVGSSLAEALSPIIISEFVIEWSLQ